MCYYDDFVNISRERWLPKYEIIQLKNYKEIFNGNVSFMDVTQKITWQTGSDHFNVTSKVFLFCYTSENDEKHWNIIIFLLNFEW